MATPLDADDLVDKAATNGDSTALETALVDFFSELTVKSPEGERVAPKRASVLAYKSHITRWILNHTDGKVDIGSPFTFKVQYGRTCIWIKGRFNKSTKYY